MAARRPPQHPFGFFANTENFAGLTLDGDDAWLAQQYPPPLDMNQRVGGSEVYAHVARKSARHPTKECEHENALRLLVWGTLAAATKALTLL